EPFSIPLILLMFKAFEEKKYSLFIICSLFLCLVKEQMPLVVVMFGILALFLRKKEKVKWALVPIIIGLIVFIIDVFVLTPYIRKDLPYTQSFFWERYKAFGQTPLDIVLYLLLHPLSVTQLIFSSVNVQWYKDLFGSWGILSFINPQIL